MVSLESKDVIQGQGLKTCRFSEECLLLCAVHGSSRSDTLAVAWPVEDQASGTAICASSFGQDTSTYFHYSTYTANPTRD